ncbi:hypothetical protein HRR80_000248 [Exophiala dermatitidis]|uniref:Uncharacterized protein n=1 Tax=Exophiala dermatitidis TaxID=5970 RepID=A0AAN6IYK1_EXODE|nr:hypothetical protein HRR95_000246 [Exophiala dermatitidis]KAJ8995477.1 hypothetical protein HRR80_000248 [Exophiala dermatitidis]
MGVVKARHSQLGQTLYKMSSSTTPPYPVAELLLVSPLVPGGIALSSKKRRITPTVEALSPKRVAVITKPGAVSPLVNSLDCSTFPNQFGWPSQAELVHIDQRLSLYKDIPFPPKEDMSAQVQPPPARRLVFTFDLRDSMGAWADPENEELLRSVFPETTGIACDGFFLCLKLRTLPPKPWPLTIAGLPLYLHPDLGEIGFGNGPMPIARLASWRNGSIAEDQNGRNLEDWEPLFLLVRDHFIKLEISITQVMYVGHAMIIALEHRTTDMNKLPFQAAKVTCLYIFDDELVKPSMPHARCLLDPAPGNPDVSQYDHLQPGLRVTSAFLPNSDSPYTFLGTTTGVLLKDRVGNESMTVAAHGFPSQCGTKVFHALPNGDREIGELITEVSHTDIALVKLANTETFSNVTFQNDVIPEPIQLRRLLPASQRQKIRDVCLDSPDTGFIEGQLMCSARERVSCDVIDGPPEQNWIATTWSYMGQDVADNLPEEICGSAMWDVDGNVLGFFRYAPKAGALRDWCVGIAADELINRGYTLVDTSDRT